MPNEQEFVSRADYDRLRGELDEALASLGEHMTQLETLQAELAEAATLQEQLEAAQGQIRGMKHYDAFAGVAKEIGIREDALKDVWEIGKWKAEGDEPDAKAMKAHFQKTIEGKDYFKAPGEPKAKEKLSTDPLGNRGTSRESGNGKLQATRAQLNDLDWMTRHQGKIGEASKSGDFEIID